jgi:hypothetical protein
MTEPLTKCTAILLHESKRCEINAKALFKIHLDESNLIPAHLRMVLLEIPYNQHDLHDRGVRRVTNLSDVLLGPCHRVRVFGTGNRDVPLVESTTGRP